MYSTKQVAEMLDKATVTIRINAAKHKIGVKLGRDWVFSDDDVKKLRATIGDAPGPKPRRSPS